MSQKSEVADLVTGINRVRFSAKLTYLYFMYKLTRAAIPLAFNHYVFLPFANFAGYRPGGCIDKQRRCGGRGANNEGDMSRIHQDTPC